MSIKFVIIGTLAVFGAVFVMDFLIHGILLMPLYESTTHLWRPMEEMKNGVMQISNLVAILTLTILFAWGNFGASFKRAALFGLLVGVMVGFPMGFGTYSYQDIPLPLAIGWFTTTVASILVSSLILFLVSKKFA